MTTSELFEALQALESVPRADPDNATTGDLIRELQIRQLELEIQNRELRTTQQQLKHSRLRYADLYDFSPVGYASLDDKGRIEEINIAGGKLLGDNPHRLVGREFTDFIVPADVSLFRNHLQHALPSRQKRNVELQLLSQDGSPIFVQLVTLAAQDADRHTLQFRTAILDITMRRQAEDAVRESQRQLEQIVAERTAELTSERRQREDAQNFLYEAGSILSMSLDYEITLWTIARAGIPRLADACVVDMVQPDGSAKRVAVAHVQQAKEQALWSVESCPGGENVIGTGRPQLMTRSICVPLGIRCKTIGAITLTLERAERRYNPFDLALAEDLADRAAIALDNATLYTKELEANRLKDEFLSVVSHELRTPLTPILGAIYKLRATRPMDADLKAALDMIERNAKAQAAIVEELLDISRITSGKLEFNRQPADLLSIIQSAVNVVRPTSEALGIHLVTDLDDPHRLVWCDRDRIQQVIWHLLSNAIKFTRRNGRVEVRLHNTPGWAHIRIADTGVGIRPDFLPHLFEAFRQEGRFATRMYGGLGAGLAIVRYIVEHHGGSVRAESPGEGEGAVFLVDLPL